ncbi:hypothetical protein STEG23_003409 [Scotinomys teguina]
MCANVQAQHHQMATEAAAPYIMRTSRGHHAERAAEVTYTLFVYLVYYIDRFAYVEPFFFSLVDLSIVESGVLKSPFTGWNFLSRPFWSAGFVDRYCLNLFLPWNIFFTPSMWFDYYVGLYDLLKVIFRVDFFLLLLCCVEWRTFGIHCSLEGTFDAGLIGAMEDIVFRPQNGHPDQIPYIVTWQCLIEDLPSWAKTFLPQQLRYSKYVDVYIRTKHLHIPIPTTTM